MKIVKPTIVDPFADAIERAKSGRKLLDLLERLTTLRVLDPACGSGNFLYVAYREMRRLEGRIRERLREEFPSEQPPLIHVSPDALLRHGHQPLRHRPGEGHDGHRPQALH